MPTESNFITDPKVLRRNDGPITSALAAHSVDSPKEEMLVYNMIMSYGLVGGTMDDLRESYEEVRDREGWNVQSRRSCLHEKGLILDTGTRRRGKSGRGQAVYVATELLSEELLDYIKNHPTARNPCLYRDLDVYDHKEEKHPVGEYLLYVVFKDTQNPAEGNLIHTSNKLKKLRGKAVQLFSYETVHWVIVRRRTMKVIEAKNWNGENK